MGPLEMFLSWQALLVAAIASPATHAVKVVLDLLMTADSRKGNRWLTRVILPALPVAIGASVAAFLPIRPEVLLEYAAEHVDSWPMQCAVYGAWGAACGQFADYLYTRVKDFVRHGRA